MGWWVGHVGRSGGMLGWIWGGGVGEERWRGCQYVSNSLINLHAYLQDVNVNKSSCVLTVRDGSTFPQHICRRYSIVGLSQCSITVNNALPSRKSFKIKFT